MSFRPARKVVFVMGEVLAKQQPLAGKRKQSMSKCSERILSSPEGAHKSLSYILYRGG